MADVDITSLSVEISAESQGAELNIDKLTTAISNLRTKGSVGKICTSLDKLSSSISALKQSSAGISGLDKVTNFLNGISSVNTTAVVKSVNSVVNTIKKIPSAVSEANKADYTQLAESCRLLMNGIAPLSVLDFSNLKNFGSVLNSLNKVPDLAQKLDSKTVSDFSTACQKLYDGITPLASQLETVGNAFAKLPPQLSKVVTQANRVTAANERQKKSYMSLSNQLNGFMRSAAKLVSLKAIADYLGNAVAKFNDFYEAANMFGVSMGDMTNEASGFIDKMEQLLGIDPSEAMNAMANIYSMTKSFGLAKEQAYTLSKSLTQLGYDLSSLKNIPISQAFTKIRSAMAGELEPMLQLGVDISQARLQQELLALGFNKQVSTLSQADKATLRYIAILKQTTDAQGDFARTLSSPANMIRVLKAQLSGLARDIGSLLYPALKSILPPLIAAVELIREFVQWVAKLMDVKVEFPDFSSASDAVGGVTDAMDDTTKATGKAAKAFKNYIMGFDELNVIQKDNGSSGGSGSGAGAAGNILGDVDLSGYDMFKNYVSSSVDEIKEKIKGLLPIIEAVAGAFAVWQLGNFIKQIRQVIDGMNSIQKAAAMVAVLVVEWAITQKLSDSFLKTGDTTKLFGEWLTAAAAAIGGYALLGPEGASLALVVNAVAQLESIKTNLSEGVVKATDASVWLQGISAAVTAGIAGAVFTKTAAGFSLGISVGAVLALSAITYGGTKGGSINPGDSVDALLTALTAAAGGFTGVTLALAAGASVPVAGAALVLGVGVGVVLEQLGVTFGKKDRIKEIEDYIKRYEDAGYTTLAIHYRLKNLGFSDNEVKMAEQGIDSTFEIFNYTFNEKLEALNSWWSKKWDGFKENVGKSWNSLTTFASDYWQNNSLIHGLIDQTNQNVSDLKKSLGKVGEAFNQRVKDIEESAAKAGKAAAEWVNGVLDKFREKRQEFFDAGKNLIQGFIDGIKDLRDKAISAVTGIADSAVDKFKTLLGIHSPSTVFAGLGGYLVEGLANGISAAKELAENAMQKLSDSVIALGQQLTQDNYGMSDANIAMTANGDETSLEKTAMSLRNVLSNVGGSLSDWLKKIKSSFTDFSDGINAVSDVGKKISQGFTDSINALSNTSKSIVETKKAFKSVFSDIKTYVKSSIAEVENEYHYNGALSAAGLAIQKAFEGAYLALDKVSTAVKSLSGTIDSIKNVLKTFNDLKTKVGEVIDQVPVLKDAYNGLKTFFSNLFGADSGVVKIVSDGWDLIKTKAGEALTFISGKIGALGIGGASGSSGGLASMLGAIGSTALPAGAGVLGAGAALGLGITGHVQWIKDLKNTWSDSSKSFGEKVFNTVNDTLTDIFNPFGAVIKIAKNKFGFAEGGFPDDGQLFLAGESGPEFVGSMGGHTAVANNDQIVEGIREGVESAMAKQNELLRQQNELLKALLEKESTSEISVSSISQAISRVNQRNGKTIIPIGT